MSDTLHRLNAFAARLAAVDPEAPGDLAAFLARARSGQG